MGCPNEVCRRIRGEIIKQGTDRNYDYDPQLKLQLHWLELCAERLELLKADATALDSEEDAERAALLEALA